MEQPFYPGMFNATTDVRNETETTPYGDLIYVHARPGNHWVEYGLISCDESNMMAGWPLKVGVFPSSVDDDAYPYQDLPLNWMLT